jgi:hypothetical protein
MPKSQGNKKGIKFPMSNLRVLAMRILFISPRAQISRPKHPAAQHFQFGLTIQNNLDLARRENITTGANFPITVVESFTWKMNRSSCKHIHLPTYLSTSISSLETLQDHRKRSNRMIILRGQIFAGSFSNLVFFFKMGAKCLSLCIKMMHTALFIKLVFKVLSVLLHPALIRLKRIYNF